MSKVVPTWATERKSEWLLVLLGDKVQHFSDQHSGYVNSLSSGRSWNCLQQLNPFPPVSVSSPCWSSGLSKKRPNAVFLDPAPPIFKVLWCLHMVSRHDQWELWDTFFTAPKGTHCEYVVNSTERRRKRLHGLLWEVWHLCDQSFSGFFYALNVTCSTVEWFQTSLLQDDPQPQPPTKALWLG